MTEKITWRCAICKDGQVSYSNQKHSMQMCRCGASGYDAEEDYVRSFGSVEVLKVEEIEENTEND